MHLSFWAVGLLCLVGTVHSSSKHFSNHDNDHSGEDRHDDRYRNSYDSCTSPSGEVGICTSGSSCSSLGGLPSGSCRRTTICCVNVTVTTCGGTATLNNTYWRSPSTVINTPSTCGLTIKPNSMEHNICQIRLDFISFTTAQPTAGTCTDMFQISGSTAVTPTICGDNSGQHMYLHVPASPFTYNDIQLLFSFASGTATRSWNIKIAMLPCGAPYLAPLDCLQYFTSTAGKVSSFNWQDVAGTVPRQLNNQNYNICFRTELVSGSKANQMCLSPCLVTNGGDAFSITTPPAVLIAGGLADPTSVDAISAAANSAVGTTTDSRSTSATCLYDFLLIAGARDPTTGNEADRFCGNQLNPSPGSITSTAFLPGSASSVQVCTPMKPFRMIYRTDGTEAAVVAAPLITPAIADTANTGFCLNYQLN